MFRGFIFDIAIALPQVAGAAQLLSDLDDETGSQCDQER